VVPIIPLIANYYLNYKYIKLWDDIDPPKPDDEDDLTLDEVKNINKCDVHFDQWSGKYYGVAMKLRKMIMFISHKSF